MNADIAEQVHPSATFADRVIQRFNQAQENALLTTFPAYLLSANTLKSWIERHPGSTKQQIAESCHELSRFQVYNWLVAAAERGEIICVEGMYYSPPHEQ